MTLPDPCGGDVKGGGECVCDPPFAGPRTGNRIVGNDAARFLSKVEQTDDCWLWRGTVTLGNYPVFGVVTPAASRQVAAHRWLYEQAVGPVPTGHRLIAVCGEPLCVRPSPSHRVVMSLSEYGRFISDDVARFWSKVEKTDGCWLWRGTISTRRAPLFGVTTANGNHRMRLAHRWLYEQAVGPIPAGLGLVATCGNSLCVRLGSGHRTLMSTAERTQVSWDRRRPSHCARGHEFTVENTRVRVDGSRLCRTCQRSREAADYLAKNKRR